MFIGPSSTAPEAGRTDKPQRGIIAPLKTTSIKLYPSMEEVSIFIYNPLFSEVRLIFKGMSDVSWSESHTTGTGSNQRTETEYYTASETYFEQVVPVYGRGCNF